ncbi:MAG: fimbrillin family protein [Bacteroides sp.]|nr:fimbrillin family protein [Bacteroides sp.]
MRRVLTLIPAFLIVLVYACHSEQVNLSYPLPSSSSILSRGESESTSLPVGSQILLNANGGISLENEIFTYNGNIWTNGQDIDWTEVQTETTVTALYPTYADNLYTSDNLYADGTLEDVLIAQETLSEKEEINLHFKHLFSSLILHIDPTLEANIQEFALTIPVKVEKIVPQDGSFSVIQATHTILQTPNDSHEYPFIIPPTDNCTLTLLITLADNTTHEVTFNPHSFQSGARYVCNISQYDSRPGIRNAEDLIAFSQLINGTYTGEATLDSFGETVGEQKVYRLLDDITLTTEDCSLLAPIGESSSTSFSDIFDGEGHTLSNLILPDKKYSGLFGHVASTGIIRNLHVNQSSSTEEIATAQYTGFIASNNNGIIENCSVTNSSISSIEKGYIGIICGLSSGTILNCYTQGSTIYANNGSITGAIVGSASGNILNCYSYQNIFSIKGSNHKNGSIAGSSATKIALNVENCYIFHNQSTKYWGAAIGIAPLASIQYFYYNKGSLFYMSNATTTSSNALIYDTDYCIDSIHISQLLNEWIETTGSINYPNYTFYKWKTATDGSACFE